MLGKRSPQRGLFEADTLYADFVGRDTFYGWLAAQRGELFPDDLFTGLYIAGWGRPSVPPSLLATALVLQTYDGVSDDEATRRAAYDLQWKVALGVEVDAKPFAKSTLQEFRAQLIIHEEQRLLFQESLELAKRRGKLGDGFAAPCDDDALPGLDRTDERGKRILRGGHADVHAASMAMSTPPPPCSVSPSTRRPRPPAPS